MNNPHLERGRLLLGQNRYELADKELRQALAVEPESAEAMGLLALCLSNQDRHREAVETVGGAVSREPDDPWVHYICAVVLLQAEQNDAARRAVNEAIRLNPQSDASFALLSQVEVASSRWQAAVDAADKALAIDPENTRAANMRSMALTQLGRRDEAGQTIEHTLRQDPEDALTHANEGWRLLHANDPKRAMKHFAEALRLDPEMDWARAGLVEAMKARNPIYRLILAYFLWAGRLGSRNMVMLIIGLIVLVNVVRRFTANAPGYEWVGAAVVLAYLAFLTASWTAYPLFNLLLRLDRLGRLALSDEQRRESTLLGLGILLVAGLGAATSIKLGPGALQVFFFLLLPLGGTMSLHNKAKRAMAVITSVLLGVAALATLCAWLPGEDTQPLAEFLVYAVLFWGAVLSTWLGFFLSSRRR